MLKIVNHMSDMLTIHPLSERGINTLTDICQKHRILKLGVMSDLRLLVEYEYTVWEKNPRIKEIKTIILK